VHCLDELTARMNRRGSGRPRRATAGLREPGMRSTESRLHSRLRNGNAEGCPSGPESLTLTARKGTFGSEALSGKWGAMLPEHRIFDRQGRNECVHRGRPLLFGGPADLMGPVALRPRIAPGLPFYPPIWTDGLLKKT
jgi:hypothetical protein